MNFKRLFAVHSTHAPLSEKVRSGIAGGAAIFLLAVAVKYLPLHSYPLAMLGSMAASAVLLFAVPHSPLAQPWNLVGGHFVSALAGGVSVLLIHEPTIAAGVGVGLAIFMMHYLNCLHPPGAATALTIILSSAYFQEMGWKWVTLVIIINVGISLLLALGINSLIPGRHYPMQTAAHPPKKPSSVISIEQPDLEWALEQMNEVVDVSEEDLASIYKLAQNHAQERASRA
ncbi:MAG: HPP family protein [Gallionellaceae bacterium]|nr:HPP family protein [Gallionellaceae bacterium]